MHARNIGLVFQNYALFPHLSVYRNVAFGLEMRGVARDEIRRRVAAALDMVRLGGFEDRRPAELSGGQQQRVALARAVVIEPDLLLLDEPLSNLDTRLREEMRGEIAELQRSVGITTVLVTHDIHEAFAVSQRVAVMRAGRIEQVGTPAELYARPVSRFVAGFLGTLNEFTGRVVAAPWFEADAGLKIDVGADAAAIAAARVLVRPERVRLKPGPIGVANAYPGTVERVVFLGAVADVQVRLDAADVVVTAQLHGAAPAVQPGARVQVGWDAADALVVPRDEAP
jgi:putative spermidine/putrescine transport system ATP-binding protein